VGFRGLTLLAEVEIFEDRGFVEVSDDWGDSAAVADVTLVDGEVGLLSFLNPLHFGKIVRNMGLIPVQNLGDLKSDLRNRLGDGLVNLFLDFALHLLLPGHLLHLAPAGHFLGFPFLFHGLPVLAVSFLAFPVGPVSFLALHHVLPFLHGHLLLPHLLHHVVIVMAMMAVVTVMSMMMMMTVVAMVSVASVVAMRASMFAAEHPFLEPPFASFPHFAHGGI